MCTRMRSAFLGASGPSALCVLLRLGMVAEAVPVPAEALAPQAFVPPGPAPQPRRADADKAVPMREVVVLGVMRPEPREVSAHVIATIGTLIGNIPIRGKILVHVACEGTFRGKISYHPMVRFFARLKGVDLISDLDGSIAPPRVNSCATLTADSIHGKAVVERRQLRGAVMLAGDSVRFSGPTWMVGDSTYHGLIRLTRGSSLVDVHVNLYERGKSPRPPS